MTKKIGILIVTCFILSIGVVVVLAAISKDMRQQPGSFLREFPPHPALEAEVLNLKYNTYYIAGGTDHHLYLSNYTAPLHMIVANLTLKDTQHITLKVKAIEEQKFWAARVKVDSPYYYLADGTVPIVYRGNVKDWTAQRYAHDQAYFQDIVPLSAESFYIRALSNPGRQNILGKITTASPHVQMRKGILQKQVDGIFCTDGMMHYNKAQNELIYLYRYRNEYTIMDTSLNVLRKQHTIDTTTRAKIKIETINSSGSTTFASPSHSVNKTSCISQNLLFVNSGLLAKNEPQKAHDNATVIDVYELSDGKYQFSFYIYNYGGKEKLKEFKVFGGKLFALFEENIQVWNLSPKYFNEQHAEYKLP
jgi:hypothetical protein